MASIIYWFLIQYWKKELSQIKGNQKHLREKGIEIQENQNYLFTDDIKPSLRDEYLDEFEEQG